MDKELKKLILIFIVLILIKSFLSYLVPSPSIFGDEYTHAKMARSFFYENEISIHGFPSDKDPPFYPMFLSLAYVFKDMTLVYLFMKVINAIFSSLIIFPAYFLAKEFLIKKNALIAAILISVLPSSFAFSPILMAENLYYPLILASIFFIYKSFTNKNYTYDIFAGLFIGLSLLTKFISIFIFLPIFVVFIYKLFKKEYYEIKKKIIMALIILVTILPWELRNFLTFGFSFTTITGSPNLIKLTQAYIKVIDFFTWNLLYLGFIVLGSGIIFFMMIFLLNKEKLKENRYKIFYLLSFFSILSIILIASNLSLDVFMFKTLFPWLTDRPVGRYVDVVLPLIILSGFISYEFNIKKFKKIAIFTSILLLFTSQLVLFPLFPINNLSLAFLGVSKYLLEFILCQKTSLDTIFSLTSLTIFALLFLLLPFIMYLIYKKLDLKKISYLFIIFFLLSSLISYSAIYFNSNKYWYNSDEMQLGLWFNNFDKGNSKVLIDSSYGGKIYKTNRENLYFGEKGRSFTIIGFFMNNEIKIGNENDFKNFDYFITKKQLDLPLIKKINNLYIYDIRSLKNDRQ